MLRVCFSMRGNTSFSLTLQVQVKIFNPELQIEFTIGEVYLVKNAEVRRNQGDDKYLSCSYTTSIYVNPDHPDNRILKEM